MESLAAGGHYLGVGDVGGPARPFRKRGASADLARRGWRLTGDARFAWGEGLDERFLGWRSDEERDALGESTVIVNCTPLSGDELPAPLERIPRTALVVDLTYGPEPTPWVRAARAQGLHAIDGLGLLVHQARRSLSLWLGREVPVEPLAAAVGWPR